MREYSKVMAALISSICAAGCPEEMSKHYIRGSVVNADGTELNDIMITVDLCDDGSIEAKEVTFDHGGFAMTESIWEDCRTASLAFDDIDHDREGGRYASHSELVDLEPRPGDDPGTYTEGIEIVLSRE
jgi:hypothetical protein